ncbi:alpha/beta fold hydrolase [Geodermatophilus sp. DSM 45219]|uniref:alpha/beta fold hydrolase n=1 Tax=Geodermatophilus sp. DSM 45219 TaxID=1881103 RepID=UPI00088CBED7|nr:alpha/beta hydrolase [Geodermatophilus sp. DSM 45219]SDO02093.1 Pimeloyl-ACP methyl ester carboxylesterase [Geodermatophilus sp. DSM 45219]
MPRTTPTLRHDTVTLPGGLRLDTVGQGDPAGTPVVLVHGWPDSWFSWSRVLAHLDPRLRAVAYSQRGFGDSDHPPAGYGLDRFADDLLYLCDALDLERAHLVGHSFGSFVVRRVAEQHPDRVDRLVLIGSADRMGEELVQEVRAAIADLPDEVPDDFAREFAAGTVHRPVAPDFFDALVAESRKAPGRVYRDSWEGLVRVDDRDRLGDVAAPTLLLWGDHDALFDRGQQDRLLAALPDAELRVYAGTGHCPNWERPDDVAADVDAFLLPRG